MYQPKTGERCNCKRGVQRDNCPACEGTGWRIDFQAIHERTNPHTPRPFSVYDMLETADRTAPASELTVEREITLPGKPGGPA